MKRKAEERNPDEFYFAMEKGRTKNGVHVVSSTEANKYTQEQLRLMKSQDIGYITLKAQAERNKVQRLQESLHLIGAPTPASRKHVVFVDDEQEVEQFDPEKYFDTPADLLQRSYNRPRNAQLSESSLVVSGKGEPVSSAVVKKAEKHKVAAYKELLQRKKRQEALGGVSHQLQQQKNIMGNGRKRKLAPEEAEGKKGVFKWKNERKR